jgi:hypothetical protein
MRSQIEKKQLAGYNFSNEETSLSEGETIEAMQNREIV